MFKTPEAHKANSLNKALDTLFCLLNGSAMMVLSIAFLIWLQF